LRTLFSRKNLLRIGVALGVVLLFSQTSGCLQFRMTQKEIDTYFKDFDRVPEIHQVNFENYKINYADIGPDSAQMVIFFHGAPGSWTAFVDFMTDSELVDNYRIISVDRPGYGYSRFGVAEPSLQKQVATFKPILQLNQSENLPILIGHSLGGPIVAKLAMEYPALVGAIIMVAPSIDPELEPKEPWRGPLRSSILNWIVPRSLRVTNEEIYFLKNELKYMLPEWKIIKSPVIIIQGGEDTLVDPKNADFAKKMITNAPIEIRFYEDVNHFIPWNNPGLIKSAILETDFLSISSTTK